MSHPLPQTRLPLDYFHFCQGVSCGADPWLAAAAGVHSPLTGPEARRNGLPFSPAEG